MKEYRIPHKLLEVIEMYEQQPDRTETDDALLIAPVLRKFFEDVAALETAAIAEIDALQLQDAMVISNLNVINRS